MEYYSEIKRNKLLILSKSMDKAYKHYPKERSHVKGTYLYEPIHRKFQRRQNYFMVKEINSICVWGAAEID